jgi:MoxR-like ATPase
MTVTVETLESACRDLAAVRERIAERVIGQDEVVERLLICLLAGGHGLFVGVPGLAKTLLVNTAAQALGLSFNRIQFTPDLMPADVTGGELLEEDRETGRRSFRFVQGPVFTQLLLADEINRTPPKTQASLLQAMQEHTVSVAGAHHPLPDPFHVFATQNPIEQEGTYPLPEAQLDRFLLEIRIDYPSAEEELRIAALDRTQQDRPVAPVIDAARVLELQQLAAEVAIDEGVLRRAVSLVRSSRPGPAAPSVVADFVRYGAGPRASQGLIQAARSRALLGGRAAVDTDDLAAIAPAVLGHRIVPNFRAESEGVDGAAITQILLAKVDAS